jgi:hypothetical protein
MLLKSLIGLLLVILLTSCGKASDKKTLITQIQSHDSPADLIEDLRDSDVGRRSDAVQHLRGLLPTSRSALLKHVNDSDSEVSAWCRTLLDELWEYDLRSSIEWKEAERDFALQKGALLAFQKTPDVFVTKPGHSAPELAIGAMGKKALPFAIEEIKRGDTTWMWVPASIVGKPIRLTYPPSREQCEEVDRQVKDLFSRDWVAWWEENKHSPEWNVFLNSLQQK